MTTATNKKEFESFPVRTLRASDNTWKLMKQGKIKSGKSWNLYLMGLMERNKKR